MATGPFVSDYWDTLPLQPMFDELEQRSCMRAAEHGRCNGKTDRMFAAAFYLGPAVKDDDAPISTVYCAPGLVRQLDCPTPAPAAKEHAPMQVAFFDEGGKEPIRDPSYRRLLVEFERRGDFMVNAKAISFPAATRSWGVIDEARIFDEEGGELFNCTVSHPPHISAGCIICFQVGELRVTCGEWDLQLNEDPLTESKLTVSKESTDYAPLSRAVGSRDVAFDPGLSGIFATFEKRYGSLADPVLLGRAKLAPREYTFPVHVGIEHGQHPYPCKDKACTYAKCGGDGSDIKPFSIPVVPELDHGQSIGGEPDRSEEYKFPFMPGVDHRQNFGLEPWRSSMITGILPAVAAETPPAPPGVIPPVPPTPSVPQPEPEEDQAAIRTYNRKIMFGG